MQESLWLKLENKVRKLVTDIIEPTIRRANENRASIQLVNRREEKTFQKLEELTVAVYKIQRKFNTVDEYSKQLIEFSTQHNLFQGQFEKFKESISQDLDSLVMNVKEVQDGIRVLEHQREHLRGQISKVNLNLSQSKGDLEQKINGNKIVQEEIYGVINAKTEDLSEKQANFNKILKGLSKNVAKLDLYTKKIGYKQSDTQKILEGLKTELKVSKSQNSYELENLNKNFSLNFFKSQNEIKKVKQHLNSEFQMRMKFLWVDTLFFITTDPRSRRLLAQYQESLFSDLYDQQISDQTLLQIQEIQQKSKIIQETPIPPSPISQKKRKISSSSSQFQSKQFTEKQKIEQKQTEIKGTDLKHTITSSINIVASKASGLRNSRTYIQSEQSEAKPTMPMKASKSPQALVNFKVLHSAAPVESPKISSKFNSSQIKSPQISPKIPIASMAIHTKQQEKPVEKLKFKKKPPRKLGLKEQTPSSDQYVNQVQLIQKESVKSPRLEQSQQKYQDSISQIIFPVEKNKKFDKTVINEPPTYPEHQKIVSQQSGFFSDSQHLFTQQEQFSQEKPKILPQITEIQEKIQNLQIKLQAISNRTNLKFTELQHQKIALQQNFNQNHNKINITIQTLGQHLKKTEKSLIFSLNSRIQQQNIFLKQTIDQLNSNFTQRKRQQSNIQSELIRLNYRIQQDTQYRHELQQNLQKSKNALQTIIEFSKIGLQLQKQDQFDKQAISLYGYKENKVSSNNSRTKPIISIDKQCISCNSQASVVLTAFKMACLAYCPSEVQYKAAKFQRKELIEFQKQMIDSIWTEKDLSSLLEKSNSRPKSTSTMRKFRPVSLPTSRSIHNRRNLTPDIELPNIPQRPITSADFK